ncbi:MAG: BlaI/MecI/CopY family transcriptional regulator [Candidatus Bipolaricaulaceae bacterium]
MARKPSPTLTEAELEIMEALWRLGPSPARALLPALPRPKAYNTVLTLLAILEKKGYVRRERQGRTHIFHPTVDRPTACRQALHHLLARFFHGSPALLMATLLSDRELGPEVRQLLQELAPPKEEG